MKRTDTLAARIMGGQVAVIAVGAAALAATAIFVAPRLFSYHFALTGETDTHVQYHAQQAFDISFIIALTLGVLASTLCAGLVSWRLTRRISTPIEHLALAAESVAGGNYQVTIPHEGSGRELAALANSFDDMAAQLAIAEESRRSLIADLAHELRTPAATLEAHIDGMEDGVVSASPETFAVMRQQVNRLRRLTNDLRTLTEVEAHNLDLHFERTPVRMLIEQGCRAAQSRYRSKGVSLSCHCDTDAALEVDTDRIQQVLANLLENSLRHTATGGSVDVAGEQINGDVTITVSDTGEGIDGDELEAIFVRFRKGVSTESNNLDGSGLGLTIARGIVTDHGGTLTAFSAGIGQGAELQMRFSLANQSATAPQGSDR